MNREKIAKDFAYQILNRFEGEIEKAKKFLSINTFSKKARPSFFLILLIFVIKTS